jgi:hypothetical protein
MIWRFLRKRRRPDFLVSKHYTMVSVKDLDEPEDNIDERLGGQSVDSADGESLGAIDQTPWLTLDRRRLFSRQT